MRRDATPGMYDILCPCVTGSKNSMTSIISSARVPSNRVLLNKCRMCFNFRFCLLPVLLSSGDRPSPSISSEMNATQSAFYIRTVVCTVSLSSGWGRGGGG